MRRAAAETGIENIVPDMGEVLRGQGMPPEAAVPPRVQSLYREAEEIFLAAVRPRLVWGEISREEFLEVYEGEGQSEADTPLKHIAGAAQALALGGFTLGEAVSREISALMSSGSLALAYMLDAIASCGAEKGAAILQELFFRSLADQGKTGAATRVLMYSPGYCGWHISAQRRLFAYLEPECIGLVLSDSFLMRPLKSISGVLAAGDAEIHQISGSFPFCTSCRGRNCRERMA